MAQHHSNEPSPTLDKFRRMMDDLSSEAAEKRLFGATGKHPGGVLAPDDEGELQFGLANYGGKVMLNFGKPVAWLGLDPEHAVELANGLIKHAREANRIIGRERRAKPLTVKL